MSTLGCGICCASTFLFLLKVFVLDEAVGKGGTSDSAEGLRVATALSSCLFFDRKRFIVGKEDYEIGVGSMPYRREPIRRAISCQLGFRNARETV